MFGKLKFLEPNTYELIFNELLDIIVLIDGDTGNIIKINSAVSSVLGYDPKTLIGKNFSSLFPKNDDFDDEDDYSNINIFNSVIEGQKFTRSDGTICFMDVTSKLIPWEKNKKIILMTLRDITEKVHYKESLKKLGNKFETIFNYASIGIILLDSKGAILLVNSKVEELFGYKKEELVGWEIEILLPERFAEKHIKFRNTYFLNPVPREMAHNTEIYGAHKNGNEIPLEVALSYTIIEEELLGVAFILDITKRKKAQIELMKARDEFLSILTHDLKAPLSSMMLLTDMVADTSKEKISERKLEYLKLIKEAGDIMLNLIHNIISASRIDENKINYVFENFPFKDLLKDVEKIFSPLANLIKVNLVTSSSDSIVRGDRDKIRHVFFNLISNALRYTPEDGTIGIKASEEEDVLSVEVWDTGVGILVEEQPKLFQKFSHIKGEKRGTGLGLYIVKKFLEGHGTDIHIKSNKGKGTKFFFNLPLVK